MEFCLVQPAFVENSDDISFTVLICDIERSIQIKTDSQRVIHFRVCHCSERLKTAYLVSFTEEILNGNLHFLCSVYTTIYLLWFLDFCIYCICFNIFFCVETFLTSFMNIWMKSYSLLKKKNKWGYFLG